jgi:hypothetical protein
MARVFFLPVVLGRLKNTMTFELQTKLALPQASCLHNHTNQHQLLLKSCLQALGNDLE